MKKIIVLATLFTVFVFSACKKETDNSMNALTIRYDFTATMAGNYNFQAITDTLEFSETMNTAAWSRSVTVPVNRTSTDSAIFTVFPPTDWVGTSNEADVTLKIFVNDVEKTSGTAHFLGLDRPNGFKVGIAY